LDLFELTRALVDIDSVTGRERAVGDFLFEHLQGLAAGTGGQVERLPVAADRFNLFASWPEPGGEPAVVLSTHLDTVPPFVPASEDAAHIWGRGACDTKGAIAAMVKAVEALLADGAKGFGLLLVVGEETDSVGATAANRQPRGARFLINGEPTENRLALGSKGALYLDVVAEGRMAHSAYPELGASAIDRLLQALDRLREVELPADPVLGATTVNIGTLAGGRAPNVVADQARAEVMIRTVGDTAGLRAAVARALAVPGVRLACTREVPAVRLSALPGFEMTVVKYTTDVPRLDRWGTPFLVGPGSIHVAHTPEERVPKAELTAAVGLYRDLVARLLQGETPG